MRLLAFGSDSVTGAASSPTIAETVETAKYRGACRRKPEGRPVPGHCAGPCKRRMDAHGVFVDVSVVLDRLFLIVLVLIQRGKGGGWPAPSAAWAARARSAPRPAICFTKITIGVATAWILLCMVTVKVLRRRGGVVDPTLGRALPTTSRAPPLRLPPTSSRQAAKAKAPAAPEGRPAHPKNPATP